MKNDLETQLKLKEIDQLDASILQFSKNTLTTKKLCASMITAISAFIIQISEDKLDNALFVASGIVILFFWILDAKSYYYQKALRIRMSEIVNKLADTKVFMDGYGMPLKIDQSLKTEKKITLLKSMFNDSQTFYFLAIFTILILFVCHEILCWY